MHVTYERMRGQTLVETLIMMPIALFALFAMIFITHFGIVNERTYLALRYAGVAAFVQGAGQAYTAANVYANLAGGQQPVPCPTPPAGAFTNTAPFPGPSSAPLWNPDSITIPACTTAFTDLGGASFLAARFIPSTAISVSASVNVPQYLQPLLGAVSTSNTAASFVHSAYPGIILFCVAKAYSAVHDSVTAMDTVSLPTPSPGEPTAPPAGGQNKC
jgi:hypothetical protein